MSFLIDANVLSEPTKKVPNQQVVEWLEQFESQVFVSVITLGELDKGIRLLPLGKRRREHEKRFGLLCDALEGRILPVTALIMTEWSKMYALEQKRGRKLPGFDSLLAATALHHKLTLVTRNVKDFPKSMPILNPWGS